MLNSVQVFLLASLPFITIADSLPKFDIAAECRSEGGAKAMLEKCIEDESVARDQLQPLWTQSNAADKASCVGETSIDGTSPHLQFSAGYFASPILGTLSLCARSFSVAPYCLSLRSC